jgi:hypothetical protein
VLLFLTHPVGGLEIVNLRHRATVGCESPGSLHLPGRWQSPFGQLTAGDRSPEVIT